MQLFLRTGLLLQRLLELSDILHACVQFVKEKVITRICGKNYQTFDLVALLREEILGS